jgi:glycosyltransferase involved in cell wall biosynthesis
VAIVHDYLTQRGGAERVVLAMHRAFPDRFVPNISDGRLAWLYRLTNALVALSHEDFGLTPLEAASFGKPSVVLRWGGFLETQVVV